MLQSKAMVVAGCASSLGCVTLPPLPPERVPPPMARASLVRGNQVVVDVTNAGDARVDEVIGHAIVTIPMAARFGPRSARIAITRERCAIVPCVFDANASRLELAIGNDGASDSSSIATPFDQRTFVRVRLPERHVPVATTLGWSLIGSAVAPISAAATMLSLDRDQLAIASGAMIGVGAVAAIVGFVLVLTHPGTTRAGSMVTWSEPAR